MEFKYELTAKDLVELTDYNVGENKDSLKFKANFRLFPILLLSGIFLIFVILGKPAPIPLILVAVAFCIFWFINSDKFLEKMSISQMEKTFSTPENRWFLKERTMNLLEDRLIETVQYAETAEGIEEKEILNISYNDLHKVLYTKNGIYIFVSNQSAFIMPKRAFKDESEMKEVYNYIESKRN